MLILTASVRARVRVREREREAVLKKDMTETRVRHFVKPAGIGQRL